MTYLQSDVENLGLTKSVKKILKNAKNLSNKTLNKYPKNIDALFIKSIACKALEEYTVAITCLKKALKILPNNDKIILEMAENYSRANQYKKAIACFDLLLKLFPKNTNYLLTKGNCLTSMNKNQEALDTYDEIQKIDPSIDLNVYRADSLFGLKKYKEVIEVCDQALAESGYDLFIMCFKADALYNLKRFEEAIGVTDQIKPWKKGDHIGARSFTQDFLTTKGRCLENLDKFEEAEKVFLDALKKSKDDAESKNDALEALGHINWIQGEYEKATEYFWQVTNTDRQNTIIPAKKSHHSDYAKNSLINLEEGVEKLRLREESKTLEFKSSMIYDTNRKDGDSAEKQNGMKKTLLKEVLLTICAFLNTDGGNLVIGVDDNKKILGIENDLKSMRSWDGWVGHLLNNFRNRVGPEFSNYINIENEKIGNKTIVIVRVDKCEVPAYLDPKDQKECSFFYRDDHGSKSCSIMESVNYIALHRNSSFIKKST